MDASIQEKRRPSAEQVLAHLIKLLQENIKGGYEEVPDDSSLEAPPRTYLLRQFEHLHLTKGSETYVRPGDPLERCFGELLGTWLIDSEKCTSISDETRRELIATMPQRFPNAHKSFNVIATMNFSYDPDLGEERRAWLLGRGRGRQVLYRGVYLSGDGSTHAEKTELELIVS